MKNMATLSKFTSVNYVDASSSSVLSLLHSTPIVEYAGLEMMYMEQAQEGTYLSQYGIRVPLEHAGQLREVISNMAKKSISRELLGRVIRNLLKSLRLSDEHIALLYKFIPSSKKSELRSAYKEISSLYAYEPRDNSETEIASEANEVLEATGLELGSDELADMLEYDVIKVEYALQKQKRELV